MKILSISDLNKENLKSFDCGNNDLNEYLKNYSHQNSKKNLSKTFVLVDNDRVIGFYSLCNAQIGFEYINDEMKKRVPRYPIPAIRLARMAVSKDAQRKGYGSILLKYAFLKILEVSKKTGIYFVIVDAKEDAKTFYEQFGFIRLSSFSNVYVLALSTIEKAYNLAK